MNWFKDLSMRSKLIVCFGIMTAFTVVVILTAVTSISRIRAYQDEILRSEYANNLNVMELKSAEDESRLQLIRMTMTSGAQRQEAHEAIKKSSARIADILDHLLRENSGEKAVYDRVVSLAATVREFETTRDERIIPLIYGGGVEQAKRLAFGVQASRFERIGAITAELQKGFTAESERHLASSEESQGRAVAVFVIVGAATVAAGILMIIALNVVIARPMRELSAAAEKIAAGDLTAAPHPAGRQDEIGALSGVFSSMAEVLRKQARETTEAVHVLASSSSEIAATTTQLAAGTEQTAAAVAETTTTVEEIKQTATMASQKSRNVTELAQNAVAVSQNGARQVGETIDGITRIREQMEYIAATIVKLSEHNQAIGDIIAAVDDLAAQSNLLAVNASIEAAKAGEHGKGFLVVAHEIKSLAEQSREATRQVRTILNDIQKSSTAAVMATEKGSKSVEAAVRQSGGSGEAIQELARTISEASQAVMQIAAASQQQYVGMDQVAIAMTNIRQAAAQNAASTRQVEATVKGLQEIGQKLKTMVDYYKV